MIVNKQTKAFELNSLFPNTDWYDKGNYIINETTEQGRLMAKTYIDNYPFVDFEQLEGFITNVIVLEEQKQIEFARVEQERFEEELLDSLIPSDKEMLMAEVEIQTITILMEVGLI